MSATPAPSSSGAATIDTILQLVAANPGTSVGIPLPYLRACWDAMCAELASDLERRRSVIIANFAHFVVQQHIGHSGTWGARVTWVPVFMLLPSFCQCYAMAPSGQTSLTHMGATTPMSVNASAIASLCGNTISRHGVINVIKDMVREIGNFVSTGKPLVLDLRFCTVTFANGKAAPMFTPVFIARLNANNTNRGASSSPRRPTTAIVAPAAVTTQLLRPTPPGTPTKAAVVSQGGAIPALAEPSSCLAPAPPAQPAAAGPTGRNFGATPIPVKSATPFGDVRRPAPSATPSSFSTNSVGPIDPNSLASPRRKAAEAALQAKIAVIDAPHDDVSPHHRRTAKKLAYRRSRNNAYEESWEQSLKARQDLASREAEADRATAKMIADLQAKAEQKALQEQLERKSELKRVQQVNLELARMRSEKQVLPRAAAASDIFDARLRTAPAPHDVRTLAAQIEERRRKEEQAKADAYQCGEAAWHEYVESKEEERRRKREAKAQQEAAAQDYLKTMQHRRQLLKDEEDRDRAIAAECTGLKFGADVPLFKARSVAIQKANYEMVLQRAVDRQEQQEIDKRAREDLIRRLELRDAALRDQEKRAKTARSSQMRRTWEQQMSDKLVNKAQEKSDRDSWRDVNFLRNESSDDDDAAAEKVSKMSPRRLPPGRL